MTKNKKTRGWERKNARMGKKKREDKKEKNAPG